MRTRSREQKRQKEKEKLVLKTMRGSRGKQKRKTFHLKRGGEKVYEGRIMKRGKED